MPRREICPMSTSRALHDRCTSFIYIILIFSCPQLLGDIVVYIYKHVKSVGHKSSRSPSYLLNPELDVASTVCLLFRIQRELPFMQEFVASTLSCADVLLNPTQVFLGRSVIYSDTSAGFSFSQVNKL